MSHAFDIDPTLRDLLMRVGTATLSSQLIKRGLRNTFIPRVTPVDSKHARMVGPAYTLSFIPSREDIAIAARCGLVGFAILAAIAMSSRDGMKESV